ncbi:hypothetical protein CspeluHIS016_0106490 [Cutaneotrichosporon spelunceum]|uniref:rRNA methyltransferase 2, mitochondrial n=1 Tax=Cutaneotrichosporon spelunceum TaxID=1672016 RepID=A0AAD3TNZ0_9TREE|nr:hypothetical protein CspeluHIS016_0106490 [Cutaneotrichosporon spelunceum]
MNPTSVLFKSSSSTRWLARQSRDPFVRSRGGSYRARSAFKLKDLATKYPILGRRVVDLGAAPGGWSQVAAERQRQYRGKGVVVAVDLLPMEEMRGVEVVTGDFFEPAVQSRVLELLRAAPTTRGVQAAPTPWGMKAGNEAEVQTTGEEGEGMGVETAVDIGLADCVLSDMMASMSGIRDRDVAASLDLVSTATWLAHQVLRPKDDSYAGGSLVYVLSLTSANGSLKFFMHPDLVDFRKKQLEPYFSKVATDKPTSSRKESAEAYWVCLGYKGGWDGEA